jgi:hypothetical protein
MSGFWSMENSFSISLIAAFQSALLRCFCTFSAMIDFSDAMTDLLSRWDNDLPRLHEACGPEKAAMMAFRTQLAAQRMKESPPGP